MHSMNEERLTYLEQAFLDAVAARSADAARRFVSSLLEIQNRTVDIVLPRLESLQQESRLQKQSLEEKMESNRLASDRRFDAILREIQVNREESNNRFESLQKQMDVRFLAQDKRFEAIDKRFEMVDKRFDDMNRRFSTMVWMISMVFLSLSAMMTLYKFFI